MTFGRRLKLGSLVGLALALSCESERPRIAAPIVSAPSATQLIIRTQPGNGVSGLILTMQPVIEVLNGSGQRDAGSTAAVTASIASGSGTLTGSTTVNAIGGLAQFADLRVNGAGQHTLRFSSGGAISSTSTSIAVTQVASALTLQVAPSGAFDGVPLSTQPRVQVVDHAGLPFPAAAIPVTATILSGNGALSGTTTVMTSGGVASFSDLTIAGSGPHLLAFDSPGIDRLVTTEFAVVAASGTATRLVVTTQPSGGTTGTPLPIQPVLEVHDASGNVVSGSAIAITASIATGTGALSGTTTVNAVNGVVTFTDLGISGLDLHTLRFTAAGLTEATTLPFRIIAASLRSP